MMRMVLLFRLYSHDKEQVHNISVVDLDGGEGEI